MPRGLRFEGNWVHYNLSVESATTTEAMSVHLDAICRLVLDLMLPEVDGGEECATRPSVPQSMLSA